MSKYKIKIGFSKSTKKSAILSDLIRFVEGVDFSHVYISFTASKIDRCLIYHADSKGVAFLSKTNFLKTNKIIDEFEIEVSEFVYHNVLRRCVDLAGSSYNFKHLFCLGLRRLLGMIGINVRRIFNTNYSRFICSVLVADVVFARTGALKKHNISKNTHYRDLSPREIYEMLNKIKDNL